MMQHTHKHTHLKLTLPVASHILLTLFPGEYQRKSANVLVRRTTQWGQPGGEGDGLSECPRWSVSIRTLWLTVASSQPCSSYYICDQYGGLLIAIVTQYIK